MTYLKTKLLTDPLDAFVKVEEEKDVLSAEKGYMEALERWLGKMVEVNEREYLKKEGEEKLPVVLEKLKTMLRQQEQGEEPDMQIEENGDRRRARRSHLAVPFQLDCEKMYTDPLALLAPRPPAPVQSLPLTATPSTVNRRKSTIAPSTPAPPPSLPKTTINPTTLPLPAYLQILSSKLSKTLHYSFSRITSSPSSSSSSSSNTPKIVKAKNIILWQPPDRQEDDSMTALGLARDPTKISSRLIRHTGNDAAVEQEGTSQLWIACETSPGVLSSDTQEGACKLPNIPFQNPGHCAKKAMFIAVWLTMVDDDDQVRATAFALVQDDGTPLEILDVDFFDDVEVALLIRVPQSQGHRACPFSSYTILKELAEFYSNCAALKYALATIRYRELALIDMHGPLDQSRLPVCLVLILRIPSPLTDTKFVAPQTYPIPPLPCVRKRI